MLLKYFYDDKLAQASYLVGCQATGEAIVVDPSRNIDPYLKMAKEQGVRVVGVTETHIHADFVSGSRELASRVGAKLYLSDEGGENWKYQYAHEYEHLFLKNGRTFTIGNLKFEVMHTPGHTPEHISLLLTDGGSSIKEAIGIFTGDFVFVGDVGRPDLLEKSAGVFGSSEEMASKMFRSLQQFKQLPDFLQVWPGHGAGSACGKTLGAVPSTTVGYEKIVNWALQCDDEKRFIGVLLNGQPEAPKYFAMMKQINKEGVGLLQECEAPNRMEPSPSLVTVQEWIEQGIVVDTRIPSEFAKKHIRGTINIPYNKSFVTWAGWLIDYNRPVFLLTSEENVQNILNDLRSIGLDNVIATMNPSVVNQLDEFGPSTISYEEVKPDAVIDAVLNAQMYVLDVRNTIEWGDGHISNAKHIMLGYLPDRVKEIEQNKPILVHCKSGGRSAIAASILHAQGFKDVRNLIGGLDEWVKQGYLTVK